MLSLLKRSALCALSVVGVSAGLTACAPPPQTVPSWVASYTGNPISQGGTFLALAAGTSNDWNAELSGNGASGSLVLSPRTGTFGQTLGTPQSFASTNSAFLSDNLALFGLTSSETGSTWQFLTLSSGAWSTAGTLSLGPDSFPRQLTDDTLLVYTGATAGNGSLTVYDLASVGGAVLASVNSVLTVPASWGPGFSDGLFPASIDGDVIVTISRNYGGVVPSRVGVFRRSGTWNLETSFPFSGQAFADVDDQGPTERIAVGTSLGPSEVSTYVSTQSLPVGSGSTWALESTITPPTAVPDLDGGRNFGYRVAVDGNFLVVSYARRNFGPATPGGADRSVDTAMVYRRTGSVWNFEAKLEPLPVVDDAEGRRRLISVDLAGTHVVGTVMVEGGPNGSARFEAWRFDRVFN